MPVFSAMIPADFILGFAALRANIAVKENVAFVADMLWKFHFAVMERVHNSASHSMHLTATPSALNEESSTANHVFLCDKKL